jgi:hypothetical protein
VIVESDYIQITVNNEYTTPTRKLYERLVRPNQVYSRLLMIPTDLGSLPKPRPWTNLLSMGNRSKLDLLAVARNTLELDTEEAMHASIEREKELDSMVQGNSSPEVCSSRMPLPQFQLLPKHLHLPQPK